MCTCVWRVWSGHDVNLFATAAEAADNKKAGGATPTPSDLDTSDPDSENSEPAEEEAVNTPAPIAGQKIELIDGHQKTWASTFVVDVEPKMPSDWHQDGKTGDYILVRGGLRTGSASQGAKPMKVATNWNAVKLFKKPKERKKILDYLKYPGVLQHDWSFFDRDITPSALMRTEEFLVDVQHVRYMPVKAKRPRKTSKED
jgi:hypothetical protein